ncbi:MAG: hypothetical protein K2K72_02325 [Duncaniella sp.]|nr:hypothetical protein [Duncaniella sp.]
MGIKTKILLTFIVMSLCACNSDLDKRTTFTFTGDSIIECWDLQSYFSSLITYNRGRSGAGIPYIESMAGQMKGKNVVVMIGTNDSFMMRDAATRAEYVDRYVSAINALGAGTVYLFEVLPREFVIDDKYTNQDIRNFNAEVAGKIKDYGNFVYLKVYDKFLDGDGRIIYEYYSDGLHLSPEGYEVLGNALFNRL